MACPLSPCGIIEYYLLRGYPKYSREKNWFTYQKMRNKLAEWDCYMQHGMLENNVSQNLEKKIVLSCAIPKV